MTIARRRILGIGAAASPPALPAERPPAMPLPGPLGAPLPRGDAPPPDAISPAGRLRRCVFRRIDLVSPLPQRREHSAYEVMCLYGDGEAGIPLGDIQSARPVCEGCKAPGIFRPDEA